MNHSISVLVTLMGAHTIGHVHQEHSGYGQVCKDSTNNDCNAWDTTPDVFDNNYYGNLYKAVSTNYCMSSLLNS